MNKFLILIVAITFNCCSPQKDASLYYKTGYDYIASLPVIKDYGLIVSDRIVHIDMSNFYEELGDGGNEKTLLLKLDSLDSKRKNVNSILPELQGLPSDTSSKYTLFFSEIIDNILLAEVIENNGLKNASHERLTAFNKSMVYLIIFDKKNQIKKVFKKEIQYD